MTSLQIVKLANKYGVDPANILISWQVQRGVSPHAKLTMKWPGHRADFLFASLVQAVVLPKSVTPSRIESNFKGKLVSEMLIGELQEGHQTKLDHHRCRVGGRRCCPAREGCGIKAPEALRRPRLGSGRL